MDKKFDAENIVLTLSAMSDIHLNGSWYKGRSKEKVINALEFSRETAKNPIDAYVFAGDLVSCVNGCVMLGGKWGNDYGKALAEQSEYEFDGLRDCFNNHIPEEAEIIYCLGNHDSMNGSNSERFIEELSYLNEKGDNKNFERMYRTDLDLNALHKGMRHCLCKGYHFLCVDYMADYRETLDFLRKNLDEITRNEPDKYVFVISHYHTPGTVYGSDEKKGSISENYFIEDLGKLLNNYPQVIYLSGHEHTSICNERAIMQTGYTAIEGSCVGCVDNCVPQGELNVFLAELHCEASESLLIEVDKNGALKITRLDCYTKSIIKNPWELPAPQSDNSHLKVYSSDRKYKAKKPKFPNNAEIKLEETENGVSVTIPKALRNNEDIFRYQIICYDSVGKSSVYLLSSLFCYRKDERYNSEVLSGIIPDKKLSDIYKISVTAQDFWLNESEPLIKFNDFQMPVCYNSHILK